MKKYIHIKLVIPSAVLKGQIQPNRSTSSSADGAFCLAACACWGSWAERKIYCASTDVPCQKRQMVKVQKHFVPKRSFPLPFLGSCFQHWEQPSALLKNSRKRFFFFKLTGKNSSTSPLPSSACSIPQPTQQPNTTDSFLDVLFYLTWPKEASQQTVKLSLNYGQTWTLKIDWL